MISGDAEGMLSSTGGDDRLTVYANGGEFNNLYGDSAGFMTSSTGGDDRINVNDGNDNSLFGDSDTMFDSQGGDDRLTSNDGSGNTLYGDAFQMSGGSKGGDDRLTSGFGSDTMYGDAAFVDSSSTGGDDTLNAAKGGPVKGGQDVLYGDAPNTAEGNGGADHFIVGGNKDATVKDYNEADGDKISGVINNPKLNEQQQVEGQLNAMLLKGKSK